MRRVPTTGRSRRYMGGMHVADDLEQMGPIDYLVVEFPGSRMTGRACPFWSTWSTGASSGSWTWCSSRRLDGSMKRMAITDLDHDGRLDLAVFEEPPRGYSTRTTSPMPVACSNRVARRASWSTRTFGRLRLPPRFGVAVRNSSRADGFRCKLCWPQSMPPSQDRSPACLAVRDLSRQPQQGRERNARTYSRSSRTP